MKKATIVFFLLLTGYANGQQVDSRGIYTNKSEIENLEIGWLYPLKNVPAKPVNLNGWNYPANQADICTKIGFWIQQTYTPTGLLGELKRSLHTPEASRYKGTKYYDYNEAEKDNRFALPHSYGAWAKFHKCLSKTSTHKFFPTPGNHCYTPLDIMANNVELITKQIIALSTPTDYYCTMPEYTLGQDKEFADNWREKLPVYRNFTGSPNLQPYGHYFYPVPGFLSYVIIMTKNNQALPFEQVTVGEFLQQLESQFPKLHQFAVNRKLIYENYLENAKKGMLVLKEKLKQQENRYVYFNTIERQIDIIDLANIGSSGKLPNWIQIEKTTPNLNFPLLRLKKGVKESCATGGPQWIVFSLGNPIDHSYGGSVQLMDNFVSRFNYNYVYNYFFGNEKVIEPYIPLQFENTTQARDKKAVTTVSATAKQKAGDKSIIFFDDFSATAEAATPKNWDTERSSSGEKPTITTIDGTAGNWLKLKKNASPKDVSLPIGGDIEISYDLLVQKGDVPWGTPGIETEFRFSGKDGDKRYAVNVSPGDMNRKDAAGWIMLALGGSDCKTGSYHSIAAFTGGNPVNKVSITIRKKGESIAIFSNSTKVYECASAFMQGAVMKKLNFYVNEKNVYYLTNIQIKKI